MSKKTEALKLALEVLKAAYVPADLDEQRERTIKELEALAEQPAQQQKPVAWRGRELAEEDWTTYWSDPTGLPGVDVVEPLYTSPQPAPAPKVREQQEPVKLWLWKNFVKGRPEYWAFDNAFPVNINNDDPQVIGEPCGYAWLKPSRQGRFDVSDEEVLSSVQNAKECPPAQQQEPVAIVAVDGVGQIQIGWIKKPQHNDKLYTSPPASKPLTDEQLADILPDDDTPMSLGEAFVKFARAIEAAHGIKGEA